METQRIQDERDRRSRARDIRRTIPEPDSGTSEKNSSHVPIGPSANVLEKKASGAPSDPPNQQETAALLDNMEMKLPFHIQRGLFCDFSVWDARAEQPSDFQNVIDVRRMCRKCGEIYHNRESFSIRRWGLNLFNSRKCGTALLGMEIEGVCCGKKHPINFRRKLRDDNWQDMYKVNRLNELHL